MNNILVEQLNYVISLNRTDNNYKREVFSLFLEAFKNFVKSEAEFTVERAKNLERGFNKLFDDIFIEQVGDNLMLNSKNGEVSNMLVRLRRGTNWHYPWTNFDDYMILVLLTTAKK
jgi:hypothetical protein